jgi:hypothetical protein
MIHPSAYIENPTQQQLDGMTRDELWSQVRRCEIVENTYREAFEARDED